MDYKFLTSDESFSIDPLFGKKNNFNNSCQKKCVQYRYIHVDSRQRDPVTYPNSNNFRIHLNERYENIIGLKIEHIVVPKTDYNINETNNIIDVQEVDANLNVLATYTTTIPIGNYSSGTLAQALQTQLIADSLASGNSYTFTVTINSTTSNDKLIINAGAGEYFRLLFSSGTNADQLVAADGFNYIEKGLSARIPMGFTLADVGNFDSTATLPLVATQNITSPNKINLLGELYVLLEIVGSNNNDKVDILEATDSVGNDVAFKIPLNETLNFVKSWEECHDIIKFWRKPKEFNHLHFKFKTFYGGLYNFRGHDISITLKLLELTRNF